MQERLDLGIRDGGKLVFLGDFRPINVAAHLKSQPNRYGFRSLDFTAWPLSIALGAVLVKR
jgi:hypothetical protein